MDFKELIKGDIYFIGIKGTGMCALAELLHNGGAKVSGSDTNDVFYTDKILKEIGIPYYEGFDASHINNSISLVIYSAAYTFETNAELSAAKQIGLSILKYSDALGEYSSMFDSTGIAGVHGKTTTTALCGTLAKCTNLPARVLAGSAAFNGRSTLCLGNKYFIAETCEYRKHFLAFYPKHIILTAIESDHQDFYPTYQSILDAFIEYIKLMPDDSELIYCADDKGALEAVSIILKERPSIKLIPYGFNAKGDYKIESYYTKDGFSVFKLAGAVFKLCVPGVHNVLNASAAIALTFLLAQKESISIDKKLLDSMAGALQNFKGSKRRTEIIGEAGGILFIDDYAHHPTAIKTTLAGLKKFYPKRRLVVSFMPHTYTRTAALLEDFAQGFADADILVLHKIYASAREKYTGGVNGNTLFEKTKLCHNNVCYIDEHSDAVDFVLDKLKAGDIFLTMGAGDNWMLGKKLFELKGGCKKGIDN
jgi:UDP-N-acetylmuramate--alanine ligase